MKQNGTMKPRDESFKYQSRKIEAVRDGEHVVRHTIRKLSQYSGQDGQNLGDLSWACI